MYCIARFAFLLYLLTSWRNDNEIGRVETGIWTGKTKLAMLLLDNKENPGMAWSASWTDRQCACLFLFSLFLYWAGLMSG